MILYETLGDRGYHTAILTTFAIDFDAFETLALNRLRGAWCRNVIAIADAGMVGLALERPAANPRVAGVRYLLAKAVSRGAGVFHPKLVLQIGRERGRMIVASANATAAGLAGNLEVACTVECDATDSGEQRLVAAGWRYVLEFLDARQQTVADKMNWARERTPWLARAVPADGAVQLSDGTHAAFLCAGENQGIANQFAALVGGEPITQLVVLSPYWDHDLGSVEALSRALAPSEIVAIVDTEQALFPGVALKGTDGMRVAQLRGFDSKRFPDHNNRFVHAKLLIATSSEADHVLAGSANCTAAALADRSGGGANEEACLYRRLPSGFILENLGLSSVASGEGLDPAIIPPFQQDEPIPLWDASARNPGAFERVYERIVWWPPSAALSHAVATGDAELEILDRSRQPISFLLEPVPAGWSGDKPRWLRPEPDAPQSVYGRLCFSDGSVTGLAIVASVELLRSETREQLGPRAERAAALLDVETEEGLWLLEALNALEEPPVGTNSAEPPQGGMSREQGKRAGDDVQGNQGEVLDYARFMAGRRRRIEPGEVEQNSLAGSGVSLVRGFLNRVIGLGYNSSEQNDDSDDLEAAAVETGDAIEDGAAAAIEAGLQIVPTTPQERQSGQTIQRRRVADANAISQAVETFHRLLQQPPIRIVTTKELLRLRALLTVVLVAGWDGPGPSAGEPSAVQVLPVLDGDRMETWPRLVGRTLAAFFGGANPPIGRLKLDQIHDRLPDDVVECFACCQWATDAALAAVRSKPACAGLARILEGLDKKVRSITELSPDEIASSAWAGVVGGLEGRLSQRLGLRVHAESKARRSKRKLAITTTSTV